MALLQACPDGTATVKCKPLSHTNLHFTTKPTACPVLKKESELTRFSWRGTLPTSFDFYTVADILL